MKSLDEIRIALESSGAISKEEKSFIKAEYERAYSEKPNIKPNCKNCWHDAVMLLLLADRKGEWTMRGGCMVYYDGILYTKKNITHAIAEKIMSEDETKSNYFYKI